MKKDRLQNIFLEQLTKVPVVQVACDKLDISRNTIYRWKHEDRVFRRDMDMAIQEGEALVNDICGSQLMNLIKQGNLSAIMFWLRNRDAKFKNNNMTNIKIEQPKQYLLSPLPKDAFEKVMVGNLPKQLRKRVLKEGLSLPDIQGMIMEHVYKMQGIPMPTRPKAEGIDWARALKVVLEKPPKKHKIRGTTKKP